MSGELAVFTPAHPKRIGETRSMAAQRREQSQEDADNYVDGRFNTSSRMRRLGETELEFARKLMALVGPEATIADIPCGSGRFLPILSGARELLMIDRSEKMLNAARKQNSIPEHVTLSLGDATDLSVADGSVDLAFCMRLFQHFEGSEMRQTVLRELVRISRRYVALSFYCTGSWRYWRRAIRGKKSAGYPIPMGTMLAEAEACGLRLEWRHPRFQLIEQQRLLLFSKCQA
jgi:hypothetical protein